MKKHLSLLAPLLALFLAFAPQTVRANVGNIDDYLIQPFTIEFGPVSNKGYLRIYTNDTYNSTIVTIDLEYRMATDDGDFGAWTRLATKGTTTSTELYNAAQTAFTLSSGHTYKIQLRGKNPEGFCKNSTDNYQILPQCYGAVSKVKMYGNIMSLIKGFDTDNLSDAQEVLREADEIPKDYCFYKLFYAQQLQNGNPATYYAPILDASNLIFPATKLRNSCYMNLFGEFYDKGTSGRSPINTGIFAGPTFLATAFVDIDGKPVTSAFQSMFLNCSALTSVKINLQYSPAANDANLLYWMKGTYAAYGNNNSNKVIFAPSIFFTSSILSNSEYISQPSTTSQRQWEQMVFSYPYSSPTLSPASADANETLTANTKKILYPLTPTTINGITYTPVDMGDGIAWADRNVGAATTDAVGDYFMWGRPDAKTSSGVGTGIAYKMYADGVVNVGDILPETADMATVNIGGLWRMPTKSDWESLNNNSIISTHTFKNKSDNSKQITLPATGYYEQNYGTVAQSKTSCFYWSSELQNNYGTSSFWLSNAWAFYGSNGNFSNGQAYIYLGMPVRAVYDPSVLDPTFKTHILRINTGDYHIDFICQHGQTVTITAVPDYENCKAFRYWDDNHSNTTAERTFTVNDDATYTAVFWSDPDADQYTATFYAADGETILDQDDYCEGQYIMYDGTTPVIAGYEFTGFSGFTAGTTQMGKTNVSFTAQYVQVFSLNATGRAGFTFTADGYDTNTTGTGIYRSGTIVSVAVAPASAFERWSDGNTDNPRNVTLSANTTLTVQMAALESDDATVDIYENVSANTTKILYYLPEEKEFKDEKKYSAIDMGYGVAWADRNVGATSTSAHGGWYQWGGTTDLTTTVTNNGSGPNSGGKSTTNTSALTATEDAATVVMGANWHMPTKAEWESLINNTTVDVSSSTFTNKTDGSKSISLPTGGYYYNTGRDCSSYSFYWANGRYAKDAVYMLRNNTNNRFQVHQKDGTTGSGGYTVSPKCVMPIRAIYVPSYTTYTLTINVGNKKYQYVCQEGQQVTVTAHATTSGYSFNEWTEDGSKANPRSFIVTGNMSYTATFAEAPTTNYYDITISTDPASGYGTVNTSSINDVEEGTAISTSSNTLTIGATTITATKTTDDAQYTYTFTGWTDDSGNNLPATLTGGLAVVAHFTRTTKQYTLNVEAGDNGSVSGGGTYDYGTNQEITATADEGYHFVQWQDGNTANPRTINVTNVTAATTYTATFAVDVTNYNLTFRAGENGSVSGTAANAAKAAGTTHSIAENTAISLTATANTFYQFKEWQNTSTHEKVSESNPYNFKLSAATDLTAVFEIANPLVLSDNENAAYYATYDDLAGTKNVNVRIERSINDNTWSTICLPFDVDLEAAGNEGYNGKFYKYMGATGDYTGIDLHFTPTGYVDANTPYLFRSDAPVTQLDFANVTLQARQEKNEGTIGNVTFRGTIAPQTLRDDGVHTILGLYENRIYYPNTSSGTYIRAFRGYFIVDGMAGVQPRVRIVVQDNNATPIEVIELGGGETKTQVRKYVEDGVMIIEKNGVRYSVTGQEMK